MRREGRYAEYDAEVDALYVRLRDTPLMRTIQLDDARNLDVAEDGTVVGVEFLYVGDGIDIPDIPDKETVERLIKELNVEIKLLE